MRIRIGNTSTAAKNKYNKANYDQISIRIRKGGRDAIQALADYHGMSQAEYIRHLVIQDAKSAKFGDISAIIGGGGRLSDLLKKICGCG